MSFKMIKIIGERNSGTHWLKHLISTNSDAEVCDEDKHLFKLKAKNIKSLKTVDLFSESEYINCLNLNSPDVLSIYIYKSTLSWIASMHKTPYHAWEMADINEDGLLCSNKKMSEFIRSKWTERGGWITDYKNNPSAYGVLAEYENVIDLRNKKHESVFSLASQCPNFKFVKYENLLFNTETVLSNILLKEDILLPNNQSKTHKNSKLWSEQRKNYYKNQEYKLLFSQEDCEFISSQINHDFEFKLDFLSN
tara:strand:+ start:61965 stop:62717 length:753 start_codon:yes stop_codon:yes gene_type:complete